MHSAVVAYALGLLTTWAPYRATAASTETESERTMRMREIATAAAGVVYDKAETPLYQDERGRGRTLALMLSVAFFESGFRRDVDLGIGKFARGEGKDSCLMQVRVGNGVSYDGWSHADLVGDRTKCFRAGLRIMRGSFKACSASPVLDRLSIYTRGGCFADKGSRLRVGLAMRAPLVPLTDAEVMGGDGS